VEALVADGHIPASEQVDGLEPCTYDRSASTRCEALPTEAFLTEMAAQDGRVNGRSGKQVAENIMVLRVVVELISSLGRSLFLPYSAVVSCS
jgi:hypothetical protein